MRAQCPPHFDPSFCMYHRTIRKHSGKQRRLHRRIVPVSRSCFLHRKHGHVRKSQTTGVSALRKRERIGCPFCRCRLQLFRLRQPDKGHRLTVTVRKAGFFDTRFLHFFGQRQIKSAAVPAVRKAFSLPVQSEHPHLLLLLFCPDSASLCNSQEQHATSQKNPPFDPSANISTIHE